MAFVAAYVGDVMSAQPLQSRDRCHGVYRKYRLDQRLRDDATLPQGAFSKR